MTPADYADLLAPGFILLAICAPLVYLAGWFAGRDAARCKQARKDAIDAEQMRTSIREYDDRVAVFVPLTETAAQLERPSAKVEARSTSIALLPQVARRRRFL